jgi:hypothetical protein
MKYYSSINLNKNELQNAVIHVVSSDGAVSAPATGQIIYDQSVNLVKYYNGAVWVAANDLSITIVGDSGSTTLLQDETLTFVGGVNLTSIVDSSDRVTFNLDPSIVLASDITVPSAFVNEITGTDATFLNIEVDDLFANSIVSTDIDAVTIDASTVNADTGNISNVNATDVTTDALYSETASIGTAVFSGTDVAVVSNLTVASDLIIGGSISGSITTSDITGVIFSVVASDAPFDIEAFETLTFEGTEDEIEVSSPVDGKVKIGIVTDPTLSGDVTITGNLNVQGNATFIESQTVTVKDPIIVLNEGASQATTNTYDIGILGERGSEQDNVAFFWDEDTDKFMAVYTSATGSDVQVMPVVGYADFIAADVEAASDVLIGGKIVEYQGSVPTTGQILIGGSTGFTRGLITGASDTGAVVTSSTDSIVVSIDIDGATDGTAIAVVSTDLLLLSDGGVEKRITVGQLGSVFVRHDTSQIISTDQQAIARTNISAVEIVKSTFTGTGAAGQTYYIPHNLGTTDVIVQIFDASARQVFADIDTDVGTGGQIGNYVSVAGNFESETYTVRVLGTRGTSLTVTSVTSLP